jgi:hypothetical protein
MRFANSPDKINSFPKSARCAQCCVEAAGAGDMSTINWFIKPTLWSSPTASRLASAWARAAGRVWELSRRGGGEGYSWAALNEHLLHDIGETRASAENELLHSPWNAPLGTLGAHKQADSRPLVAFRTSPLG